MQTMKIRPGDVYRAHVADGATIAVHAPTGRTVSDWTAEDEVILGESVSDLKGRGYTVTARR